MNQQQLVLGSTSAYRRAVLEKLDIDFITARPDIDETRYPGETPIELVKRLSESKARVVAKQHPEALIIGSDQVASVGDTILTKPGNHENAVRQLEQMAGQTIVFHSGLCLFNAKTGSIQVDVVDFTVVMRNLTRQQIEHYVEKDQPFDSAGSFKSEGLGIALFATMIGNDPNALIGLPLIRLIDMLEQEQFHVL